MLENMLKWKSAQANRFKECSCLRIFVWATSSVNVAFAPGKSVYLHVHQTACAGAAENRHREALKWASLSILLSLSWTNACVNALFMHITAQLLSFHFSNLLITLLSNLFLLLFFSPLWGRQRSCLFLVFSLHLLPACLMRAAQKALCCFSSSSLQPCRARSVRSLPAAAAWGKPTVSWTQLKPKTRRQCSLSTSRYLWFKFGGWTISVI